MTKLNGVELVCKNDFDKFRDEQNKNWGKQEIVHARIDKKLSKIEPLAELIDPLREVVDNRKALDKSSKWIIRFLGVISMILGIIYTLYRITKG